MKITHLENIYVNINAFACISECYNCRLIWSIIYNSNFSDNFKKRLLGSLLLKYYYYIKYDTDFITLGIISGSCLQEFDQSPDKGVFLGCLLF